jgi:cation/acetate symporter
VAVICAVFVSFVYVTGQMRGVGVVFARFLEVDINVGVVIGVTIVFVYATLGGMKGITWRLNQIHADLGFSSYTEPFANPVWHKLNVFCTTLALMVGTVGSNLYIRDKKTIAKLELPQR